MSASESGSVAVLAEKPSVARDIARVLGANAAPAQKNARSLRD
jgi:hypothetical protein